MNLKILFCTIQFLFSFSLLSQRCLPDGLKITRQGQIDSFSINYPDCNRIEGPLNIIGSEVSNLKGLSQLEEIGYLSISSTEITNLEGFENLKTIRGDLRLQNLEKFEKFKGFENLESIEGIFLINGAYSFKNFQFLNSLKIIGGYLQIAYAYRANSFKGLENLESIGGLSISSASISNFKTFEGLNNLEEIKGDIYIHNSIVESFSGLENLEIIDGRLDLFSNPNLSEITSLKNVNQISGLIRIDNCFSLKSIEGLEGFEINPSNGIWLYRNENLTECSTVSVCEYLRNESNPQKFAFESNSLGCNSREQILDKCQFTSIESQIEKENLYLFPNPSNGLIFFPTEIGSIQNLGIFNNLGELKHNIQNIESNEIDLSFLNAGIYFIQIKTSKKFYFQKLIKV